MIFSINPKIKVIYFVEVESKKMKYQLYFYLMLMMIDERVLEKGFWVLKILGLKVSNNYELCLIDTVDNNAVAL